jgi:hypothetical protein
MIMKLTTITKTLVMGAVAALTLVAPTAKAGGRTCSNATLKGTFADKDTGFLTAPPAMAGPFAGVNLETFDGHGALTGAGVVSLNGNIVPATFRGTYTVNPDCTGTYTVQNSLNLTVHAFFVIADGGDELQIVITDPGTVITCVARRQSRGGDSEQ